MTEAQRAVQDAAQDPRSWLVRAVVRHGQRDWAGAEEDATRSLRLDPELERRMARQVRATARLSTGRPLEALEDAEALVLARTDEVEPEIEARQRRHPASTSSFSPSPPVRR